MATKRRIHEGTVEVCAHQVSFWFELPPRKRISQETRDQLTEEAEERAKACITEGYVSGELNHETDELSCRGWWDIIRN